MASLCLKVWVESAEVMLPSGLGFRDLMLQRVLAWARFGGVIVGSRWVMASFSLEFSM